MLELSAFEITEKIRSREFSIPEVVDFFIQQIEEKNPKLNAVVEDNFSAAREKAKKQQAQLAKMSAADIKALPELFGVPYTMKEMLAVQGKRSTMGSLHRKESVMNENATVVERIEKAGGILLGMTNVPEAAFWFECDNVIYGKSNNPYDISRTPGGSSGGEAAILGAGASPFGIGSDIGGSIRMPAAFCGIFGHKPSDLIVPTTGEFPIYRETAADHMGNKRPFAVIGPMTKKAKDLYPLMKLLSGPDGIDLDIKKNFKLQPLVKNAEDIRVFSLPSPYIHGASSTEPALENSVTLACRYLKEMGSPVSEVSSKFFIRGFELWLARAQSMEGRNFASFLSGGVKINYKKEFAKLIMGKRNYTFPALLTAMLDEFGDDRQQIPGRLQELAALRAQVSQMLGKNGVLIMPVHPRLAPKHHSTYLRPFDFAYTGIINALGMPATSVPMGLTAQGLPMSVQVIANEDCDHLCLSVAEWLETAFGGWQKPPN